MERLTAKHYKESDGYYMRCSETCHIDCGEKPYCEEVDNLVDRLGKIEDILGDEYDLERLETILSQCMTMRQEVAEKMKIVGNVTVERLREIMEAENIG